MTDGTSKKSGSERRERKRIIGVRVTDDELAEITAEAERTGLTIASYARSVLLSAPAPRARRRPSVDAVAVMQLLGELGKIGSNLNQIAHHLNAGRAEVSPAALDAALRDMSDLRAAIMEAVGRKS